MEPNFIKPIKLIKLPHDMPKWEKSKVYKQSFLIFLFSSSIY